MAFSDNDVIRVSCKMQVDLAEDIVNVYHIKVFDNGTGTLADQLNEVGEMFGLAYTEIEGLLPNNLTANVIDVYNVTQDVPYGQVPWGGGFTGGTATGSMMPIQDAFLVLWLTNTKRLQGKTYLGPFTTAAIGDGIWAGGTVSAVGTFASYLMDGYTGALGEAFLFGIYSRTQGTFTVPSGRRLSQNPATQRRRRKGRGS